MGRKLTMEEAKKMAHQAVVDVQAMEAETLDREAAHDAREREDLCCCAAGPWVAVVKGGQRPSYDTVVLIHRKNDIGVTTGYYLKGDNMPGWSKPFWLLHDTLCRLRDCNVAAYAEIRPPKEAADDQA